jgi:hypothetical protein
MAVVCQRRPSWIFALPRENIVHESDKFTFVPLVAWVPGWRDDFEVEFFGQLNHDADVKIVELQEGVCSEDGANEALQPHLIGTGV